MGANQSLQQIEGDVGGGVTCMSEPIPRVRLADLPSRELDDHYKLLNEVGAGTYGRVYKACLKNDATQIFAVKQLEKSDEREGFPLIVLREIKILQKLEHKNILRIREIVTKKTNIKSAQKLTTYFVMDYMQHDLYSIIKQGVRFTLPMIKCLTKQLLDGLCYLEDKRVLHRDIKSANLLMNQEGILKLADFGLARFLEYPLRRPLSPLVQTLWYRAPEILLGDRNYSFKCDMWSAGIFLLELLLAHPPFPADKETEQFTMIARAFGIPDENEWPGVTSLKNYNELVKYARDSGKCGNPDPSDYIRKRVPNIDEPTFDLVISMLQMNPDKRFTARQALDHYFFSEEPLACTPNQVTQQLQTEYHDTVIRAQQNREQRRSLNRETFAGAGDVNQKRRSNYFGAQNNNTGQSHSPTNQAGSYLGNNPRKLFRRE